MNNNRLKRAFSAHDISNCLNLTRTMSFKSDLPKDHIGELNAVLHEITPGMTLTPVETSFLKDIAIDGIKAMDSVRSKLNQLELEQHKLNRIYENVAKKYENVCKELNIYKTLNFVSEMFSRIIDDALAAADLAWDRFHLELNKDKKEACKALNVYLLDYEDLTHQDALINQPNYKLFIELLQRQIGQGVTQQALFDILNLKDERNSIGHPRISRQTFEQTVQDLAKLVALDTDDTDVLLIKKSSSSIQLAFDYFSDKCGWR